MNYLVMLKGKAENPESNKFCLAFLTELGRRMNLFYKLTAQICME